MPRYAVLNAGQIVEYRDIPNWEEYPEHKRAALDEKGDGGPVLRLVSREGDGPVLQTVIEQDRVREVLAHPPLDELKAMYKAKIDADAEACRGKFITLGSGQILTYMEKHNQAVAVHEMGETAANAMSETDRQATFPTLSASVGVEAPTLWECSQIVLSRYLALMNASFVIEQTRLVNKKLISLASDAAAARAAYEAITWPTP